jgi:hypothetical protein
MRWIMDDFQPLDDVIAKHQLNITLLLDGGALIRTLSPRSNAATFENYLAVLFMKHIEMELRKTPGLGIIWDSYCEFQM